MLRLTSVVFGASVDTGCIRASEFLHAFHVPLVAGLGSLLATVLVLAVLLHVFILVEREGNVKDSGHGFQLLYLRLESGNLVLVHLQLIVQLVESGSLPDTLDGHAGEGFITKLLLIHVYILSYIPAAVKGFVCVACHIDPHSLHCPRVGGRLMRDENQDNVSISV